MKTITQNRLSLAILLTLSVSLAACSSGFQPSSTSSPSNGSNGSAGAGDPAPEEPAPGNTPAPQEDPAWQDLEMDGSVNGGRFDKTQVVAIDKVNKELVLRLPMLANPFLDGAILEVPFPKVPGARLALDSLSGGGSALVLRIPLEYVLRGIEFLPPSRLPNGDPIPSIPSGELPSTAVQLNPAKNINAALFLAPTFVGLYVNTPFDPFVRLTLPVRDKARTRTWGYFTTIPAKPNGVNGGFFISFALPDDLARVIDNNL